ncbi:hypothetical protein FRC09_008525 [Ceratobasidium sp. 395]|nr:hypothetical protein FRC09_008525 [Ceratobasidium sp. 395]
MAPRPSDDLTSTISNADLLELRSDRSKRFERQLEYAISSPHNRTGKGKNLGRVREELEAAEAAAAGERSFDGIAYGTVSDEEL